MVLDNLLKAREKLKEAECESELVSDNDVTKRKRKRNKILFSSSSDESDNEVRGKTFISKNDLPVPPAKTSTDFGLLDCNVSEPSQGNLTFTYIIYMHTLLFYLDVKNCISYFRSTLNGTVIKLKLEEIIR